MGFILLGLVTAGMALLIRELLRSPEGYEDEAGFHYGSVDQAPTGPPEKVETPAKPPAKVDDVLRLIPEGN